MFDAIGSESSRGVTGLAEVSRVGYEWVMLDITARKHRERVTEILQQIMVGTPDEFWHYSSVDAMNTILETSTFWATDIDFLNDPEEGRLLWQAADGFANRVQATPEFAIDGGVRAALLQACSRDTVSKWAFPSRAYVVCFSEEGDSLNQWRLYGREGLGCAIGISRDAVVEALKVPAKEYDLQWRLARIAYGTAAAHAFVAGAFAKVLQDTLAACARAATTDEQLAIVHQSRVILGVSLHLGSAFFKSEHYAHEKEVRLFLFRPAQDERFRTAGTTLIPYVTSAVGLDSLIGVRCGPRHSVLSQESMRRRVARVRSGTLSFSVSTCPYRPV